LIPDFLWKPFLQINLFRPDGSGELGVSRVLLMPKQTTPTFWAASDEGDLVLVDWSIKPPAGGYPKKGTAASAAAGENCLVAAAFRLLLAAAQCLF
jgi:hypothetical protein